MISKKNRLKESDIRKVFQKKKPFFSYMLVANVRPNTLGYARLALFLSSKVTKGSVNRNYFRRQFYDASGPILCYGYDIVIVPKKGTQLCYKNPKQTQDFLTNIHFLYSKIIDSHASL